LIRALSATLRSQRLQIKTWTRFRFWKSLIYKIALSNRRSQSWIRMKSDLVARLALESIRGREEPQLESLFWLKDNPIYPWARTTQIHTWNRIILNQVNIRVRCHWTRPNLTGIQIRAREECPRNNFKGSILETVYKERHVSLCRIVSTSTSLCLSSQRSISQRAIINTKPKTI